MRTDWTELNLPLLFLLYTHSSILIRVYHLKLNFNTTKVSSVSRPSPLLVLYHFLQSVRRKSHRRNIRCSRVELVLQHSLETPTHPTYTPFPHPLYTLPSTRMMSADRQNFKKEKKKYNRDDLREFALDNLPPTLPCSVYPTIPPPPHHPPLQHWYDYRSPTFDSNPTPIKTQARDSGQTHRVYGMFKVYSYLFLFCLIFHNPSHCHHRS